VAISVRLKNHWLIPSSYRKSLENYPVITNYRLQGIKKQNAQEITQDNNDGAYYYLCFLAETGIKPD